MMRGERESRLTAEVTVPIISRAFHAVPHYSPECTHLLSSVYPIHIQSVYLTRTLGLIQTVEKLQKKCVIKFSETAMRIICNHEEGGVQVWS